MPDLNVGPSMVMSSICGSGRSPIATLAGVGRAFQHQSDPCHAWAHAWRSITLDLEISDDLDQRNREVIVDLAFLVTGTSGIGNFRLPRLEAIGVHSLRRLLAVTLDPSLHYEEQLGDDIKTSKHCRFLAAWGTVSREPQLVYAIPQGTAAWLLATRPAEVHNIVEQLTICSFGQGDRQHPLQRGPRDVVGPQFPVAATGPD